MIEQVLTQALRPDNDVTPEQLRDLLEMFITDMHLRKSMGQFWMDVLPMACEGIMLCGRIRAEFAAIKVEGLTPEMTKTFEGARDLSVTEINAVRRKLYEKLLLLKQCPDEGAKIH